MKRLTYVQASALRKLRKVASRAADPVSKLAVQTCWHCDHEDSEPTCPICVLDKLASTAEKSLTAYRDRLDRFLERGPHPKTSDL